MGLTKISKSAVTFLASTTLLLSPLLVVTANAEEPFASCDAQTVDFCDNFEGTTWYQDEKSRADWYRWQANVPPTAAEYIKINQHKLRLLINEEATADYYVNADISTSKEFDPFTWTPADFIYEDNVRVEANFRLSDNISANPYDGATFKGSAGFLLWNSSTFDIIGFSVNDNSSFPYAGFWVNVVIGGQDYSAPLFDVDVNAYHTYTIERTPTQLTLLVDDVVVYTLGVNGEGQPVLSAETLMAIDLWVDNATNTVDFTTFEPLQLPNDIVEPIYMDIDYFSADTL